MIAAAKQHAHTRPFDWSFLGQMTHSRRIECVNIKDVPNGKLLTTEGFTQGVAREKYYASLVRSKWCFALVGHVLLILSLLRSLEAGAIPIADDLTPNLAYLGYWSYVFGSDKLPFPVIRDWMPAVIEECLADWERKIANARRGGWR
jgi:hypothetical protein